MSSTFPYKPSFLTRITAHAPNDRIDPAFGLTDRVEYDDFWLRSHEHLDVVLRDPPIEAPEPLKTPRSAQMTYVEPIRLTPDRGAQLFICDIQHPDATKPERWVAKIFDPMYYHFYYYDDDAPRKSTWTDVAYEADRGYSTEAATYAHLERKGLTGTIVPIYGGSWTFELPVTKADSRTIATCVLEGRASTCDDHCTRSPLPDKLTRSVRMILIENLQGETMRQLLNGVQDGLDLNLETRKEIWAQCLHVEAELLQANVSPGDAALRNIMVCTSKDTNPSRSPRQQPRRLSCAACERCPHRVVFFDFDRAVIHTDPESPAGKAFEKPPNPMNAYYRWPQIISGFEEWWAEWYTDKELRHRWLLEHFGGDHLAEYDYFTLYEDPDST